MDPARTSRTSRLTTPDPPLWFDPLVRRYTVSTETRASMRRCSRRSSSSAGSAVKQGATHCKRASFTSALDHRPVAVETEAEAVRMANATNFGLAAAVISSDGPRCRRVANALEAGIVWVNCSQPAFCDAPWGGYKRSGVGRELGEAGFNSYLETKQVTTYLKPEKPLGWYSLPPVMSKL